MGAHPRDGPAVTASTALAPERVARPHGYEHLAPLFVDREDQAQGRDLLEVVGGFAAVAMAMRDVLRHRAVARDQRVAQLVPVRVGRG